MTLKCQTILRLPPWEAKSLSEILEMTRWFWYEKCTDKSTLGEIVSIGIYIQKYMFYVKWTIYGFYQIFSSETQKKNKKCFF